MPSGRTRDDKDKAPHEWPNPGVSRIGTVPQRRNAAVRKRGDLEKVGASARQNLAAGERRDTESADPASIVACVGADIQVVMEKQQESYRVGQANHQPAAWPSRRASAPPDKAPVRG